MRDVHVMTAEKDSYVLDRALWTKGRNIIVFLIMLTWVASLFGAFADRPSHVATNAAGGGVAQVGLQDWKAARGTYTTAVRLWPVDPEAHAGLGVALAKTKDPKATVQLAWLTTQVQACKGACAGLAKYKSDVESAIAVAAKGA